ncbi:MAG: hypothetical protein ACYCZO_00780 [Daejeonella sp.]
MVKPFIREIFRAGTIASIAMVPFGLLFSMLGLRMNHYGQKIILLLFSDFSPGLRFVLFILEHLIVSWVAAIPLVMLLFILYRQISSVILGVLYGIVFYVLINSLLLPLAFGDATPWQLSFTNAILPSLLVHIVYGGTIAFVTRSFVKYHHNGRPEKSINKVDKY